MGGAHARAYVTSPCGGGRCSAAGADGAARRHCRRRWRQQARLSHLADHALRGRRDWRDRQHDESYAGNRAANGGKDAQAEGAQWT